jgi:glycosyltransferase involved in cell wall biosynthesis
MRIAYIITRLDLLAGAQLHVRDLALSMVQLGHEIYVLARGKGPLTEALQAHGVRYIPLHHMQRSISPYHDAMGIREIRSVLKGLHPDLVTTHSSKAGFLGRIAGFSLNIPTVFTAHGWSYLDRSVPWKQRMLFKVLEKMTAPLTSRIVTVCERDWYFAHQELAVPVHKLVTIHYGIQDIPTHLRAHAAECPPRLIMIARLEPPEKDHPSLLRALATLPDIDWELDLVGEGPLRPALETMCTDLRIAHRVRFLGERPDVPDILSKAQICVLLSKSEGLPLSLLEAMRAGIPVVASSVGGIPEAVKEGVNGYLVPNNHPDLLRARLQELLTDAALRLRMGRAGRQMYEASFTFHKMVSGTLQVYEQVIYNQ